MFQELGNAELEMVGLTGEQQANLISLNDDAGASFKDIVKYIESDFDYNVYRDIKEELEEELNS